jgi:hypothetical protein
MTGANKLVATHIHDFRKKTGSMPPRLAVRSTGEAKKTAPATSAANVLSASQVRAINTRTKAAAEAANEEAGRVVARTARDQGETILRQSAGTEIGTPPVLDVISQSEGASVGNESLTENTNPTRMYCTEVTTKFLFKNHVKTKLFPKKKFIDKSSDLNFSNDPTSVCRFLSVDFQVQDREVEIWWDGVKGLVYTAFKNHRNNVIRAIQKSYMSMCSILTW